MSLKDCLSGPHNSKFDDKERADLNAQANKLVLSGMQRQEADRAIVQKYLDAAVAERQSVSDLIRVAMGQKPAAKAKPAPKDWTAEEPAAVYNKSGTLSKNAVTGDLTKVNPDVREAVEARIGRMSREEQRRVRANLKKFAGTAWAAAAVKGMAYREMLERAMAGQDTSSLERNDIWGKQDMSTTALVKAFKKFPSHGDKILKLLLNQYDIIGANRKAENDVSTSFTNCDPSKACATFCYAAAANARPAEIAKSEFTEFMLERFPEEMADKIFSDYMGTPAGHAGLSLRINDKGDLSEAQVNLIENLNSRGMAVQIFSKRPDLLEKLSDLNLKMLSIDSTNVAIAEANQNLRLAVTITDDMTEEMLTPLHDRVSVYMPVNLKGREVTAEELKVRFPNLYPRMKRENLCPVDAGAVKVRPGTSFVDIKEKTAEKGLWTCTACDLFGAVGCFSGDRKTNHRRAAVVMVSDVQKQLALARTRKALQSNLKELLSLGGITDEQYKQLVENLSSQQRGVRAVSDAEGNEGNAEDSGRAAEEIAGSRRGTEPAAKRTGSETGVKEPDAPYEEDLFGAPVARPAAAKPKKGAAAGNVDTATTVFSDDSEGTFATRTKLVTEGYRDIGLAKVKTIEDAAQAMAYLGRHAVERFDALITDKNGKPLAIVGSFKGAINQTAVYPATLTGEAFRIKGAAHIWMAHNHPSGLPVFSQADRNLTRALAETFRGSNIKMMGLFAIAGNANAERAWNHTSDGNDTTVGYAKSEQTARNMVPITERVIDKSGNVGDAITSPMTAKNVAVKVSGGKSGIVLLDSQNVPVAFVPVSNAMPLRESGRMDALYRAVSVANAGAGIIVNHGDYSKQQSKNLAGFLNSLDVRTLDVMDVAGGGVASWAETGGDTETKVFYSRAQPFYSQLSKVMAAAPDKLFTSGNALKAWLGANAAKHGIKKDEILWSGIEEYLALRGKEKITRGEVNDFLSQNVATVDSTVLGESLLDENGGLYVGPYDDEWAIYRLDDGDNDPVGGTFASKVEAESALSEMTDAGPTKFATYVPPGGIPDTYRETLLTLPTKTQKPKSITELPDGYDVVQDDSLRGDKYFITPPGQGHAQPMNIFGRLYFATADEAENSAINLLNNESYWAAHNSPANFKSSHWRDVDNVVVHIRHDEVTGADGKRYLRVIEIQSDWGQEGKKEGFRNPKHQAAADAAVLMNGRMTVKYGTPDTRSWSMEDLESYDDLVQAANDLHSGDVPAAPFVTDTRSWVALGIKRAIIQAVSSDVSGIVFATGQENIDNYPALVELVSDIRVVGRTNMVTGEKTRSLTIGLNKGGSIQLGVDANGVVDNSDRPGLHGKSLADIIGKEIADKVMSGKVPSVYTNLDLKVGGEGMRAFYDKIVPSVAGEVVKKLGGKMGRVEAKTKKHAMAAWNGTAWGVSMANSATGYVNSEKYATQDEARAAAAEYNKANNSYSAIEITQAMRDKVLGEGLPLFNRGQGKSTEQRVAWVEGEVNRIKAGWKNAPEIIVASSMSDTKIPEAVRSHDEAMMSQGAEGEPVAFIFGGKVYVIAGQMKTSDDIATAVFHEALGHAGLNGVFGEALKPILRQVMNLRSKDVAAKAKEYGLDVTKEEDRLIAAEEVLAEMAEKNPQSGFVQRAIAAIRKILRDMGLKLGLTDNDIINNYLLPARAFVQNGGKPSAGMAAMFSRNQALTEQKPEHQRADTNTRAFMAWFGDSKVVDADGKPLVVHHGGLGASKITEFSHDYGGQTTGNNEHGAFHFTDDPVVADDYGRQSFIRRYQDNPEALKEDGYAAEDFDFDTVDVYAFVEELAEENIERQDVYLRIENPIVVDMEGGVVDVQQIEELTRFAMTGKDPNGEFFDKYSDQMFDAYDPDLVEGLRSEIEEKAREEFGLDEYEPVEDWQFEQATEMVMDENGYERERKEIDGIIIRNMVDDIGDESNRIADQFIAIDPGQIKSINNEGSFSTINDDIRYSRRQTGAASFKKWFGDSRVVDDDGAPLVVYHGTAESFTDFATEKMGRNYPTTGGHKGFFFTSSPGTASVYAEKPAYAYLNPDHPESADFGDGTANIVPVYLSLQNPIEIKTSQSPDKYFDYNRDRLYDRADKAGADGFIVRGTGKFKRDLYVAFEPNQIKSAIGNNGEFDTTNPDIRYSRQQQIPGATMPTPQQMTVQPPLPVPPGVNGSRASWDSPEDTGFDDFVYKLQDKHIDMKRVIEKITKASGKIADKWNAYLQEELFHGRAAKRTTDFVDTELAPALHAAAAAGLTLDNIDEYLHARHAKEANELIAQRDPNFTGPGSGMETADAQAYLAGLPAQRRRDLEAVAAKIDAIIAKTRQLYVGYGLVSQDTVDEWGDMFQHYVPLMREDHDHGMGIGQGYSIKGREVKHRTGSTAPVIDIVANIAMQREKVIVRGEKNRVAVAVAGLAKMNKNPDFWSFDTIPAERVLNEKTGLIESRVDPMFRQRDNVVIAKIKNRKGEVEERAIVFNEHNKRAMRMATALKNMDVARLEGLMGASAVVTRYFSAINTQWNPVFGFVNITRDVQGALINLRSTELSGKKAEVLGHTFTALFGIYGDARLERKGRTGVSKWAKLWEEFQDEGGQTGYRDLHANSNDRANKIKHALDPNAWMDSKLGKVFTANGTLRVPLAKAQEAAGWIFDLLSDFNLAMENAVRLAAYKTAIDSGATKQRAASLAKNLTVNFNRKGQAGQQAGALYAFFNASVQGTARMAETLTEMKEGDLKTLRLGSVGKAVVAGGVLLGIMQAVMLAAAGFDDDEPPEFIRQRNVIIPLGGEDHHYITIPMPLGYHVIPNIGRTLTEMAMGRGDTTKNGATRVLDLLGILADAFNPVGGAGVDLQTVAPTVLDPFVALATNKDWTGKPIAKVDFNSLAPTPGFTRVKTTASSWSRALAETVNSVFGGTEYTPGYFSPTPDQIDYLAGQITGGVGRELSKTEQTVTAIASGSELPAHKIPLLGRYYGNTAGQAGQANRYYANLKRLNIVEGEVKGRREARDPSFADYAKENPEYRLVDAANKTERQIANLKKLKRTMQDRGADKETIRQIDDRITQAMTGLNERVDALAE